MGKGKKAGSPTGKVPKEQGNQQGRAGQRQTNTNDVEEVRSSESSSLEERLYLFKVKDLKGGVVKPLDAEQAKRGLSWVRKAEEVLRSTEGVMKEDGNRNNFHVYLALDELVLDINARAAWESVSTKEDRLAAVKRWFESPSVVEASRRRIEALQRLPSQTVLEFVNLLIVEYRDTFPSLSEREVCAKVLSGYHWPVEMERDRFGFGTIEKYSDLISRATNISAVEMARKMQPGVNAFGKKQEYLGRPAGEKKQCAKKGCKKMIPTKFQFCQTCFAEVRRTKACFKCGEPGHVKKDCGAGGGGGADTLPSVSAYDLAALSGEMGTDFIDCDCRTAIVEVIVGGRKLKALVDSGAAVSLFSPGIQFDSIEKRAIDIRFANGSMGSLSQYASAQVEFIGSQVVKRISGYVCPNLPADIIIGCDVIFGNIVIDGVNRQVKWNDITISAVFAAEMVYKGKVYPCLAGLEGARKELILKYIDLFERQHGDGKWRTAKVEEFSIDLLPDANLRMEQPRSYDGEELEFLQRTIKSWLQMGIIRQSNSKTAVQMLVATDARMDGSKKFRLAANYIPLNKFIKPMNYPLPNLQDMLDKVGGETFSVIDAVSGHLRVPLRQEDWSKTAFRTPHIEGLGDLFEFCSMPWGLNNSGRHYQFIAENILRANEQFPENLLGDVAVVSQDDVVCFSKDGGEAGSLDAVEKVLKRMLFFGIVPNWSKSVFFKKEVKAFGVFLTKDGVRQDPARVQGLMNLRAPENYSDLGVLLGMLGWHRQFVPKYAELSLPLYDLQELGKEKKQFRWDEGIHGKAMRSILEEIRKDVLLFRPGPGIQRVYVDMAKNNRAVAAHLSGFMRGRST